MSFYNTRNALARGFVDPQYTKMDVEVAKFRAKFQSTLNELQDEMDKATKGKEAPEDPHKAAIHHTGFLVAFDQAKDHAIKYLLACMCVVKPKEE